MPTNRGVQSAFAARLGRLLEAGPETGALGRARGSLGAPAGGGVRGVGRTSWGALQYDELLGCGPPKPGAALDT